MLGERLRNLRCFELSGCVLDSQLAQLIGMLCACVCACLCVCVNNVCARMCVCMCECESVRMRVRVSGNVNVNVCICAFMCVWVCVRRCVACVCLRIGTAVTKLPPMETHTTPPSLGTHCKRLRQLALSGVKVPDEIDGIIPALTHVDTVYLYSCSDGSNIARAIRDSPIHNLSVYTTSSKFINELLVEWTRDSEPRWLCDLTFDGCDEETCDVLLECGKRERLKAQEMNLTFSTDLEIDDTDVERMQQSLRERLCLCNPHGVTLRVEGLLW